MRKKKAKRNRPPMQYEHDVTVVAYDYGYVKKAGIYFRNGCEEQILIDGPYIRPNAFGKRLYFLPGYRNIGNRIVTEHANKRVFSSRRLIYQWAKKHVGDYDLKYDRDKLLYYIGE